MHTPHKNLSDSINKHIIDSEVEGGAWYNNLPVGKALRFQTENNLYTLRRMDEKGWTIQGHPKLCPTPTKCVPQGSTWGGSMIKVGFLGRGMHFECSLMEGSCGAGAGVMTTSEIKDINEVD